MANLFLTGSGAPTSGIGEATDYYRDTGTNLIYYKDSPTNWVGVPSLIPTPDGVGTTWLYGSGEPSNSIGEPNDYYRNETNGVVYRKDGSNEWQPKGTLDFIGIYGVQWGNGLGAPTSTPPLDGLPAGSFYLDVQTSDIYFKNDSLAWVLKGQLGGGGGSSSINVVDNLESTSATDALSANMGNSIGSRLDSLESNLGGFGDIVTHNSSEYDLAGTAAAAAGNAETAAKAYAEGLVVGLWDDRGSFSAASGNYPTSADVGSGEEGGILKGDIWTISAAGTLPTGRVVEIGDVIRALVDDATNTANDWAITQNNIGYVPENSTNKSTDNTLGGVSPSDTFYPTQKSVKEYVANNFATVANQRYQFVSDASATYTVPASAVTENGRTMIELSNSGLTSITVNTSTAIGKTSGDYVYVSITGAYGAQALVAGSGVTLEGDLTFSYQHQTKCLIFKGGNTWKVVG